MAQVNKKRHVEEYIVWQQKNKQGTHQVLRPLHNNELWYRLIINGEIIISTETYKRNAGVAKAMNRISRAYGSLSLLGDTYLLYLKTK